MHSSTVPPQPPAQPVHLGKGVPGSSLWFKLLFTQRLEPVYRYVRERTDGCVLQNVLDGVGATLKVKPTELDRVPKTGPVVVVSNHPFGILDGAALGAALRRIRPDVKILTNYLVSTMPELASACIYVDPFRRPNSAQSNIAGLKQALSHLRSGGMLILFPAGEVSHWQFGQGGVIDPEWNPAGARLARLSAAKVLPAFVSGRNSAAFQVLGAVHPALRTLQLPFEVLNKAGKEIELRFGAPISSERLAEIPSEHNATQYLRWRSQLLARGGRRKADPSPLHAMIAAIPRHKPVAAEGAKAGMLGEIARAGTETLEENKDFAVYAATGEQVPNLLNEIGRLRETAFRAVGEGTGKPVDLDEFDAYYTQIILWNKERQEVAGGYRLVESKRVIEERGMGGLYTSTLFRYAPDFFRNIGPAFELGRSFVALPYQRHFSSLLMLWKGISRYVSRRPATPVLFGAVSMSSSYTPRSRDMVVRYFERAPDQLARLVEARHPFRPNTIRDWEVSALQQLMGLDELSSCIADVEQDGKGIPVLFRQYLKVGGRMLGFHVDPGFANSLDGLVLVDLRTMPRDKLDSYMGKTAAEKFLRLHQCELQPAS